MAKRQNKIPKEFLAPRPMSANARTQSKLWDVLPFDVIPVAVAVAVAVIAPLSSLDESLHATLLRMAGQSEPPRSTAVLSVSPAEVRGGQCSSALADIAERGNVRALLLLTPTDELCAGHELEDSEKSVSTFSDSLVRMDSLGRVLGFRGTTTNRVILGLGFVEREWVAPRAWEGVPRVRLEELTKGLIEPSVLADRIVFVALEDGHDGGGDQQTELGPRSSQIAAAAGAGIEDRSRRAAGTLAGAVVALLFSLILVAVNRKRADSSVLRAIPFVALSMVIGMSLAGAMGFGSLLPIPTLLLSTSLCGGILALPRIVARRRADESAGKLLKKAAELRSQALHTLPGDVFWERLARRAAQAHPADDVLLAELAPYSWRLKVWANGQLNEGVIRERRRDIRRTPYSTEQGVPVTSVVHDYLVMKDVPTVMVPLVADGDVEGYMILIGSRAEKAFLERPSMAQQLSGDLAQLIRQRRLTRLRNDDWKRAGGMLVQGVGGQTESLLEGARAAVEELHLFNTLMKNAPVGLLYADSFGDVRILGQRFLEWLPALGVNASAAGTGGAVPPGVLTLAQIMDAFAKEGGMGQTSLSDIGDGGLVLEVDAPTAEDVPSRTLKFSIRRLDKAAERDRAPGFVASLVVFDRALSGDPDNVAQFPQRGDPLVVFSLAELLTDVVKSAARRSDGSVRLQTPREHAHVVAHKGELASCLEEFLVEAARHDTSEGGPVITVRERRHRVELTILDLRLGVPSAALKRALLAPSQPPAGLEVFGTLVRGFENSHGLVEIRSEEGWGVKLTASLVRARPQVQDATAGVVDIGKAKSTRR